MIWVALLVGAYLSASVVVAILALGDILQEFDSRQELAWKDADRADGPEGDERCSH